MDYKWSYSTPTILKDWYRRQVLSPHLVENLLLSSWITDARHLTLLIILVFFSDHSFQTCDVWDLTLKNDKKILRIRK